MVNRPNSTRGRPRLANPASPAERMRRYRARKRAAGLRPVTVWRPDTGDGGWSDHRILDARSLALHCAIARKLAGDPALLDIARGNLAHWEARRSGAAPRVWAEWATTLDQPLAAVLDLITSFDERAIRLRQSSPFAGVLDAAERDRIHAAF